MLCLRVALLFILPMAGFAPATTTAADWQYQLFQQLNQHQGGWWQHHKAESRIHQLSLQHHLQTNNQQLQLAASSWLTEQSGADYLDYKVSEAWWGTDVANWSFSVGRRKRDFDVNHALRPLDLFSPVDPLALYTLVAPGVWQVAADWFGSDNALTLLCNQTQQPFLRYGQRLAASWGCGGRYYQQSGTAEWQALMHHDAEIGWRAGGSWQQVLTEALAWQSSWLWQQHSWQSHWIDWPPSTATQDLPLLQAVGEQRTWQFSAGLNYSFSQYNLLMEYGYDGQAPADKAWRALRQRFGQGALQPVELRSSRQLFSSARLSRQQWLLHLRSSSDSQWQHAFTVLHQPAVRGLLISASLSYSSGQHSSFSLGIKHFAGPGDSAFSWLGLRSEVVAGVSYAF